MTPTTWKRLWNTDARLMALAAAMLGLLVLFCAGLVLDPRSIGGAPAWLKPAKFAASIAIFAATLAWVFTFLPGWPRLRRAVSWTTVVTLVVEIVIIGVQAWRGTTSHFNVSTPLDAALFSVMGIAIMVQTAATVAVAAALWKQPIADAGMQWALRLGTTLTIVGAVSGGFMVAAGAHTVGAPDGGPGLPGTAWSVEHGDLRTAHFVGLHAWQALPIVAWMLRRGGRRAELRVRAVAVAAASYAALYGLLLWQAVRGQPIVRPDGATLTAVVIWGALTTMLWVLVSRDGSPAAQPVAH